MIRKNTGVNNNKTRLITIGTPGSLRKSRFDFNAITTGDLFAGGSIEQALTGKKLVVARGYNYAFAVLNTVTIFYLQGGATTSSLLSQQQLYLNTISRRSGSTTTGVCEVW